MGIRWNIGRISSFLGIIALLVFFITDQQQTPDYPFFCVGALLLVGGIWMIWRYRPKPVSSSRFSLLRKMGDGGSKKRSSDQGKQLDLEKEKGKEVQ